MSTRVLVVCGGGASSGFLAQNIRKAAKKSGATIEVIARSDSEVPEYADSVNVLLIGPHLAYMEEKLRAQVEPAGVKVALLTQNIYGRLDGAAALSLVQELVGSEGES
jgi:PTS system cellobiose-specific IIB component